MFSIEREKKTYCQGRTQPQAQLVDTFTDVVYANFIDLSSCGVLWQISLKFRNIYNGA